MAKAVFYKHLSVTGLKHRCKIVFKSVNEMLKNKTRR